MNRNDMSGRFGGGIRPGKLLPVSLNDEQRGQDDDRQAQGESKDKRGHRRIDPALSLWLDRSRRCRVAHPASPAALA